VFSRCENGRLGGIGAGLELSLLWVHGRYPGTPVVDDSLASHLIDGARIGLTVQPQKAVNVSTASLLPFESIPKVGDGENSLHHFVEESLESTSQVLGRDVRIVDDILGGLSMS
jgi:hypothetical protein